MPERQVLICNRLGLHARASACLAELASRFHSDIQVKKAALTVNAKSIMGLMLLAAAKGSHIVLMAQGEDAEAALDALEDLVNRRFGEDE